MDMYREQLLEHYHHPKGYGLVAVADAQAEEYNQVCGDRITVQLILKQNVIQAMRFEGHSCAISTACASLLVEFLPHKTKQDIATMNVSDIEQLLGFALSPARIGCGLLALSAAQKALTLS